MRNCNQLSVALLVFLFLLACNNVNDPNYALKEEFNGNTIGWPEESTSSHIAEIKDGRYWLHSVTKDTNKYQTSVSPQRAHFLLGLPRHYKITTAIQQVRRTSDMEYGMILVSASLTYRFELYDNGDVLVSEYDYNTELTDTLVHKNFERAADMKDRAMEMTIEINDRMMQLSLDGVGIGASKIKTRQWQDLMFYTTRGGKISIDYLRIQKLK